MFHIIFTVQWPFLFILVIVWSCSHKTKKNKTTKLKKLDVNPLNDKDGDIPYFSLSSNNPIKSPKPTMVNTFSLAYSVYGSQPQSHLVVLTEDI